MLLLLLLRWFVALHVVGVAGGAQQCDPQRAVELVEAVAEAWRCGLLPVGGTPGSFGGINGAIGARAPKRSWQNGTWSNSLSRQTQHHFMWDFVDRYGGELKAKKPTRCLDWDGWYVGSIFASVCDEMDVIEYGEPFGATAPKALRWAGSGGARAKRWYLADAHSMASYLDHGAYDLIIANSVFEHLHQPFVAMREVAKLLKPDGLLFWHTPFEFEQHGVPHDFFRYSVSGARALAESAGLEVDFVEPDGGYVAVLSNVLGIGASFWQKHGGLQDLQAQPFAGEDLKHYLSTRMVARKGPTTTTTTTRRRRQTASSVDAATTRNKKKTTTKNVLPEASSSSSESPS